MEANLEADCLWVLRGQANLRHEPESPIGLRHRLDLRSIERRPL